MEELLLAAGATAPGYQARISHDRATDLCENDSYEEAIHYFDQALAGDSLPSLLPDIWYNKGCALDELGRLEEAIACYDRAFELDPRAADALNRTGVALGKLGNGDKQLACFQKAVVADPKNANSWSYLGRALSSRREYRKALVCYDKLLALNPEDATAWFNKGITLAKLGIDAEALDCHDRLASSILVLRFRSLIHVRRRSKTFISASSDRAELRPLELRAGRWLYRATARRSALRP